MSNTFHEGWLSHKGDSDKKFRKAYGVLKRAQISDVYLYLFCTDHTRNRENYLGGYEICSKTDIKVDKKDKSLITLTTIRRKKDGDDKCRVSAKFKFDVEDQRPLWLAYLIGLAHGQIPQEHQDHLLPGQKKDVVDAIDKIWNAVDNDSGIFDPLSTTGSIAPPLPPRKTSDSASGGSGGSSRHSSSNSSLSQLASPTQPQHKFYSESYRNQTTPRYFCLSYFLSRFAEKGYFPFDDWFFNCSRDDAENALRNGKTYGSSLVRPATRSRDSSIAYIVSFCDNDRVHHLKVAMHSGLFLLPDIKTSMDKTFSSLYDIISYIQDINPAFVPMKTNDLNILGVSTDSDYDTFLPVKPPVVGVKTNPAPDYDGDQYDEAEALKAMDNYYGEIKDDDLDDDEQPYALLPDDEGLEMRVPSAPPATHIPRARERSMSVPSVLPSGLPTARAVPPNPPAGQRSVMNALLDRVSKLSSQDDEEIYEDTENGEDFYDEGVSGATSGGGLSELQRTLRARRNVIHDVEDYESPDSFPQPLSTRGRFSSEGAVPVGGILSQGRRFSGAAINSQQNLGGRGAGLSFEEELKQKLASHFIYEST